ncbi:hypothetical protein ACJIZ3_005565 [Penstemon smallii]|uniref:Glutamate/phenylalanine/leucine/valine/L-tryptophan dehydrogenase C-terminal domain-containing protein n=1 Tax=Penstemon smallii TaxID=265156 RepID=A0ABD3S586_9LAMI
MKSKTIIFRIPLVDDNGRKHANRGFCVLFNGAKGPHKGGLRFHPSMNLSTISTLKNALSPNRLRGSSGGSDFDPKGKSDNEILRFCQSFMNGLFRHLNLDKDLPYEEMGVGTQEIGYLFGQYRVLAGHSQVSLANFLIADHGKEIHGLRCVLSGFGKIAMNVLEKLIASGGHPVTISNSKGYLLNEVGFSYSKLSVLKDIKTKKGNLSDYTQTFPSSNYIEGKKPWGVNYFVAFPCASEMEIDISDVKTFEASRCKIILFDFKCNYQFYRCIFTRFIRSSPTLPVYTNFTQFFFIIIFTYFN